MQVRMKTLRDSDLRDQKDKYERMLEDLKR